MTGESFWFCRATGVGQVALPLDAVTACGWAYDAGQARWVHGASGASSSSAPSLVKAEAKALINAHLAAARAAAPPPAPPAPSPPPLEQPPPAAEAEAEAAPAPPDAAAPAPVAFTLGGRQQQYSALERGRQRVAVAEELLARTRRAGVGARMLRALSASGAMTEACAATMLQLRWRQLRARRLGRLWGKVLAMDGGGGSAALAEQAEQHTHEGLSGGGGGGGSVRSLAPMPRR